jgi:integral membrane protein
MKLSTVLGRLRLVGFLEGLSFVLLLGVAMPLKYLAGEPEAVRIVGMAHGVLFLAYLAAILQAHVEYGWTWKKSALLVMASVLPLGPFVADRKLLREEDATVGGRAG